MQSNMNDYLTRQDFSRFEDRLWERFDRNDNLSRSLGERIAIVETKTNTAELRLDNQTHNTRKTAASWGATVGTAAAGFVYGLLALFWKGHGGQ